MPKIIKINRDFLKLVGKNPLFQFAGYLGEPVAAERLRPSARDAKERAAFDVDAGRNFWNGENGRTAKQVLALLPEQKDEKSRTDNQNLLQAVVPEEGEFGCAVLELYCATVFGIAAGIQLKPCNFKDGKKLDGDMRAFSIVGKRNEKDFRLIYSQQYSFPNLTAPEISLSAVYTFKWKGEEVTPDIQDATIEFLNEEAYNKVKQQVLEKMQSAPSLDSFNVLLFAAAFPFFGDEEFRTEFLRNFFKHAEREALNAEREQRDDVISRFFECAYVFFDQQNYPGQFNRLVQEMPQTAMMQSLLATLQQVKQAQKRVVSARHVPVKSSIGMMASPHICLTEAGNRRKELHDKEKRLEKLICEMCKAISATNCAVLLQNMISANIQLARKIFIERMAYLSSRSETVDEAESLAKVFLEKAHSKLTAEQFNALLDSIAKTLCHLKDKNAGLFVQHEISKQLDELPNQQNGGDASKRFTQSVIVHTEVLRLKSKALTNSISKRYPTTAQQVTAKVRKAGNEIEELWEQANKKDIAGSHPKAVASRKQVVALCELTKQAISDTGEVILSQCQQVTKHAKSFCPSQEVSSRERTIWWDIGFLFTGIGALAQIGYAVKTWWQGGEARFGIISSSTTAAKAEQATETTHDALNALTKAAKPRSPKQ